MSADFNSSFGGYKESGIGREHGPYAIEEYLLDKTISIEPSEEVPDEVLRSLQRRHGAGLDGRRRSHTHERGEPT